jgi:hypothetical protein
MFLFVMNYIVCAVCLDISKDITSNRSVEPAICQNMYNMGMKRIVMVQEAVASLIIYHRVGYTVYKVLKAGS